MSILSQHLRERSVVQAAEAIRVLSDRELVLRETLCRCVAVLSEIQCNSAVDTRTSLEIRHALMLARTVLL